MAVFSGASPVIVIPGIGQSRVDECDSSGRSLRRVWPVGVNLKSYVGELSGPFLKLVMFKKHADLRDKLCSIAAEILDPIAVNPDGSMRHNLKAVEFPRLSECDADQKRYVYKMVPLQKLAEAIGEEKLYFFSYNSFDMPYVTAEKLDAFVSKVKAENGSEKVSFIAVSLGGVILDAYLDAYGAKGGLDRIINVVSASMGTVLADDLMAGNIDLSAIPGMLSGMLGKDAASSAEKYLAKIPDRAIEDIAYSVIDVFRKNLGGSCGSLWGAVTPGKYASLADKYIKNPALKEQTDRFNSARDDLAGLYRRQTEEFGVKVFVLLGYDLDLVSLAASHGVSSDGIVSAASASLGAVVGKTGAGSAGVDPSAGLFPDSTWFFKGVDHEGIAKQTKALDVITKAISDPDFTSVLSDPELPQFN
ncbi:MAG: hypothetical protein K6C36_00190 [Clostridia bacterium]|nr:hypothetical protein [Clostridia bacterium]